MILRKNTTTIEDLALFMRKKVFKRAVNLTQLAKHYAEKFNVTIKWDGSTVEQIQDGKFFVGTKAVSNKGAKLNKMDDIANVRR